MISSSCRSRGGPRTRTAACGRSARTPSQKPRKYDCRWGPNCWVSVSPHTSAGMRVELLEQIGRATRTARPCCRWRRWCSSAVTAAGTRSSAMLQLPEVVADVGLADHRQLTRVEWPSATRVVRRPRSSTSRRRGSRAAGARRRGRPTERVTAVRAEKWASRATRGPSASSGDPSSKWHRPPTSSRTEPVEVRALTTAGVGADAQGRGDAPRQRAAHGADLLPRLEQVVAGHVELALEPAKLALERRRPGSERGAARRWRSGVLAPVVAVAWTSRRAASRVASISPTSIALGVAGHEHEVARPRRSRRTARTGRCLSSTTIES